MLLKEVPDGWSFNFVFSDDDFSNDEVWVMMGFTQNPQTRLIALEEDYVLCEGTVNNPRTVEATATLPVFIGTKKSL